LQSFKDWLIAQESSAATRSRSAAFYGTGPKIASPFSHSTPPPGMVNKLLDDLDEKPKKKKKDKKDEGHEKMPDYSFDAFLQKVQKTKQEIDQDLINADKAEKDMDEKDKEKQDQEEKDADKPENKFVSKNDLFKKKIPFDDKNSTPDKKSFEKKKTNLDKDE